MLFFVSVGFAEEVPTVSLSISKTVHQEEKVVISSENIKSSFISKVVGKTTVIYRTLL
jgi:hypothetical protein